MRKGVIISFGEPLPSMSCVTEGAPHGEISFIHFRDGKRHTFYAAENSLTGDRMCAFDSAAPSVGESVSYCQSVFRDIYSKATKVLGFRGTREFAPADHGGKIRTVLGAAARKTEVI